MPMPTKRTDALVQDILERIASGETMTAACRVNGITPRTWQEWRGEEENSPLALAHARATELGHDALAEQCIEIADTEPETIRDAAGNARRDSAYVAWQKARIDTRLKLLGKVSAKYSDNRLELTGKDGGAIELNTNNSAVTELVSLIRAAKRGPAIEQASAPAALPDDSAPDA